MSKYIKLSDYAKNFSISYKTAYRYWKDKKLKGFQDSKTGTIFIEKELYKLENLNKCILYARVSSSENISNLDSQLERLRMYAIAKGYTIVKEIKETASGLNDKRPKLLSILESDDYLILLVEHKDRLTRLGFNYLDVLLKRLGVTVEVINLTEEKSEDLIQDFVSIITSFCARIYGIRRSKRKTERLIEELKKEK